MLFRVQSTALGQSGVFVQVAPGATVTVRDSDGLLADLFSDSEGAVQIENPQTASASGGYDFYVPEADYYDIETSLNGQSVSERLYIPVAPSAVAGLSASDQAMTSFLTRAAFEAAIVGGLTRENGARVQAEGVVYEALEGASQLTGLPGWKLAKIDTTERPFIDWSISDQFAGAFKSVQAIESTDANTYTGPRSTLAISRTATGSGTSGIEFADTALHVLAQKADIHGTAVGEIDGMRINAFSNARSDAGGLLIGLYKKVGDGSINEGGGTTIEASVRRFTDDIVTLEHWHQQIVGFTPNPGGPWAARDPIGFYSEVHKGDSLAHFAGINDGNASPDLGTVQWLIAGYQERDPDTRYFSVDDQGNMESRSFDAGASASPLWSLYRDSASPAADDLIGRLLFRARNSAAEQIDYARIFGAVHDPADGAEDGQIQISTMVNGNQVNQVTIRNGMSLGNVAPLGTASLNAQSGFAIQDVLRIDAGGGIRPQNATAAQIADTGHVVNTANKVFGKIIFDTTNSQLLFATGSSAAAPWVRLVNEAGMLAAITDAIGAAEFLTQTKTDFTPAITFATPGTSSVAYTSRVGHWIRTGDIVEWDARIEVSSITKGTASGDIHLDLDGIGLVPAGNMGCGQFIEKPSLLAIPTIGGQEPMNMHLRHAAGESFATIVAYGKGSNVASIPIANIGTGSGTFVLAGKFRV